MKKPNIYSPHLEIAKKYWENFLNKRDIAIDATTGNGHDSLFLATILSKLGRLYCIDIQKKAIDSTTILLKKKLTKKEFQNISIIHTSHEDLQKIVEDEVNLIVYNLGYLPTSDKKIITKAKSTINSIKSALAILAKKAAISIMSYVGHAEGEKEYIAIRDFLKTLDRKQYSVICHTWLNREKAPIFFWIEKI
ncbi:MAG: Ribosomal RNA small subunit methyltransferase H [Candidatus Anoxychlamydiales bacterium]|nr:Ribosomal RNA small subunit methyltransferase H [Candidatus Anoxychlamydiales bacterium]